MRKRVWIVLGIVAVLAVIGAPSCGPSAAKQQAAKHDAHTSVHDGGKAHTGLYDKAAGAEPPAPGGVRHALQVESRRRLDSDGQDQRQGEAGRDLDTRTGAYGRRSLRGGIRP